MAPGKSSLNSNCLHVKSTCLSVYSLSFNCHSGASLALVVSYWCLAIRSMSSWLVESFFKWNELYFVESLETFLPIPNTRNALLHLYLGQIAEYLCQSQLCEQIASQAGCGGRQLCPAMPHSSTEKTSVPHKPLRRPRPRPASAVLDLRRPNLDRDLYDHYSEVGSLCRRRRRPAPTMQHSPGQRRMAARSRPCSVIETSVTREMQSTELHHRVRCQMNIQTLI